VALLDVGHDGEMPYLVMELVDGTTLGQRMVAGKLSLWEARRILLELLSALDHAHCAGIVHRDLKPANILLRQDGMVKVTDFGLAKLDESVQASIGSGTAVGTPHYMSPEQAAGRSVDARSDLFSIGVIAYELLTGRKPFEGAV